MAPLANSPVLNAARFNIGVTDQRGLPMFGTPDVGAFEWQPGDASKPTLTIRPSGASLIVSWERAEGYLLEETRSLWFGCLVVGRGVLDTGRSLVGGDLRS